VWKVLFALSHAQQQSGTGSSAELRTTPQRDNTSRHPTAITIQFVTGAYIIQRSPMRVNIETSVASTGLPTSLALQDPSKLDPTTRAKRRERLRGVHIQCGVDAAYLTLPPGHFLWFVSVGLDVEVHAGCLGFTRNLYEFALGTSVADAIDAVRQHFAIALPHAKVVGATASLSNCNHPEELTFPEQIRRKDIPHASQAKRRTNALRS